MTVTPGMSPERAMCIFIQQMSRPLLAQRGHSSGLRRCLLIGAKQTSSVRANKPVSRRMRRINPTVWGRNAQDNPPPAYFRGEARDTLFLNVEQCATLNLRYRLGGTTCPSLNVRLPVYRLSSPAVSGAHCRNRPPARMKAAKVCFTFTNLRAFASNLQGERMHLCCPGEVKSPYRRVVCSFLRPSCFAEPCRFTAA